MTHRITLIPGDGIGPEVTEAVLKILAATGISIDWERHDAGILALEQHKTPLPPELIASIREQGNQWTTGGLTFRLARAFGFCYGVDKAIDFAYETRRQFPDRRRSACRSARSGRPGSARR